MRVTCCWMTICALLLTGVSALAEDEQAEAAFDRGTAAFKEERFDEAVDAFREAYRLRPSWKILYNIGHGEAACKRYGLALDAFEQYLVKGGDEVPLDRQRAVREEIERLQGLVGYLKVIAPEGAMVSVDGVERDAAPLVRELPVAAAVVHAVTATRGGALQAETVGVRSVRHERRPPPGRLHHRRIGHRCSKRRKGAVPGRLL